MSEVARVLPDAEAGIVFISAFRNDDTAPSCDDLVDLRFILLFAGDISRKGFVRVGLEVFVMRPFGENEKVDLG